MRFALCIQSNKGICGDGLRIRGFVNDFVLYQESLRVGVKSCAVTVKSSARVRRTRWGRARSEGGLTGSGE